MEITFTGETVDGVPSTFEAVDVFTLEDGLIRRLTTWYDLDTISRLRADAGHAGAAAADARAARGGSEPVLPPPLDELAVEPDAVAADLDLVPGDAASTGSPQTSSSRPRRSEVRQVVAGGSGAVPLTSVDVEERGRVWGEALVLGGVGRDDTVLRSRRLARPHRRRGAGARPDSPTATMPTRPGRRWSSARRRDSRARATASARALTVLELPETGVVASSCAAGTMHAHTRSHVVEIVDGALVVTPLGARGKPLLRWATRIEAAWLGERCTVRKRASLASSCRERAPEPDRGRLAWR